MSGVNHYAVLGVRRNADAEEIRVAYVRQLKYAHPDHQRATTYPKARVDDIQRAYHCLRDVAARSAHDSELQAAADARARRARRAQRRLATRDAAAAQPPRRAYHVTGSARSRWRTLLLLGILAAAGMQLAGFR